MDSAGQLQKNRLFKDLTEQEVELFQRRFKMETYSPRQFVFQEGEAGESLYIVQRGQVSINKAITSEIQKKLFSARSGSIFGEFSFMDRIERSASAMAEEESVVLCLSRSDFDSFIKQSPKVGQQVFSNLLGIVVQRLRQTTESYKDAVRWSLEITGTQKINFQYLITESVDIRIELLNGKTFEGKVMQLEKSDAGFEVIMLNKLGKLAIIPYHAIISVTLIQ